MKEYWDEGSNCVRNRQHSDPQQKKTILPTRVYLPGLDFFICCLSVSRYTALGLPDLAIVFRAFA